MAEDNIKVETEEIAPDEKLVEEIKKMNPYKEIHPKPREFVEVSEIVDFVKSKEVGESGGIEEPMTFRASSIGYCIRMNWYAFMMQATEEDADFDFKTGAADRGNVIHDMMTRKLMKAGIWAGDNQYIGIRKYRFTGHLDALIRWNGELAIVEMKSMNRFKYPNYIRRPDEHHIMQLQSYLWMRKLDTGYLLPYNKDTDKWTILKTKKNDDIIKIIENKLKLLNYYANNNICPERPWKLPDENPNCKWCHYYQKCWC